MSERSESNLRFLFQSLIWSLATAAVAGWAGSAPVPSDDGKKHAPLPFAPLPTETLDPKGNPTSADKVALGKRLFFDARLSGDNSVSCATCHIPTKAFTDGLPRAKARNGQELIRNTPTLFNVGYYATYFWDGRSASLEDQALVPIQSPVEMNQDLAELEHELSSVAGYVKQFKSVFGTGVSRDGIARALAAFQRTLVVKASPFDRYLQGDATALSEAAKEGLRLFAGDAGCVRCHRGPLLSDGKFYRLGVGYGDAGRRAVTGKKEDNEKFRTPSLRNITLTAPYMHDGSLKTLEDVVSFYYRGVPSDADIQPLVGRSYSEIAPIVAFLESLTGELPEFSPPELP